MLKDECAPRVLFGCQTISKAGAGSCACDVRGSGVVQDLRVLLYQPTPLRDQRARVFATALAVQCLQIGYGLIETPPSQREFLDLPLSFVDLASSLVQQSRTLSIEIAQSRLVLQAAK